MSATVQFLRTFNRWRRGDTSLEQPSPRVIGQMIDAICDKVETLTRERDEARAMLERKWDKEDPPLIKMMQERDEAREDAKRATYDAAQETIKVSTLKSHWIEACRERDQWKSKFVQANKDYGFELRDPCGTIWDHAKKLQQKCDNLQDQRDFAMGEIERLRSERDEARIQYRSTLALAEVLANKQVKLKAERDEARALLEASK